MEADDPSLDFQRHAGRVGDMETIRLMGTVQRAAGLVIESNGPPASLGEICEVLSGRRRIPVEVIGFRDQQTICMPIGRMVGIQPGDWVVSRGKFPRVPVGNELLGRVFDGNGEPLDGLGPLRCKKDRPLHSEPVNPLKRMEIREPMSTGVRAIDACLTLGKGQRIGLFGGSGIGKSTLLAMMAKNTHADVSVLALVGERGREVRAFIEDELGDALARSVVVVATSEYSPLLRIRAALAATAIAEHFREQGQHVLLMMDSLTRFTMAQREVGLAAGEPPTTKGYTPSGFSMLPSLVERAGLLADGGSITGVYTVLVEGDDMTDPVADAARSLLDGHIILSRSHADRGHFPAIDMPASLSRPMPAVVSPEQRDAATRLRAHLATLSAADDLIQIGAYKTGSNPEVDEAIAKRSSIESFLRQGLDEPSTYEDALAGLMGAIASEADGSQTT